MQLTTGSHWFGVVLLFVAAMLLVVASITAPVVQGLSFFNVAFDNTPFGDITVRYGAFGSCFTRGNASVCRHVTIGYKPCEFTSDQDSTLNAPSDKCKAANGLTNAMVLHPVACATGFVAAFVAMAAGFGGSLAGGIIACLAWLFTVVAMGIDFTVFGIVKKRLDDLKESNGARGDFGPPIWCVVAAFVFLTVGTPIVLYTCFRVRRAEKQRTASSYSHGSAVSGTSADDKDNNYRP